MDHQENQEGNIDLRRGIAPFKEVPPVKRFDNDGHYEYVLSGAQPIGSFGFLNVTGKRYMNTEEIPLDYNPNDNAITTNADGEIVLENACELAEKGYFDLSLTVVNSHPIEVMKNTNVSAWIENGDNLITDPLDMADVDVVLTHEDYPDIPNVENMREFRSNLNILNKGHNWTFLFLSKEMLPRLRIGISQTREVSAK